MKIHQTRFKYSSRKKSSSSVAAHVSAVLMQLV